MKHQHQTFILGMIKHGDKIQAYRAAYPNCNNDETARKSAERLLLHHPAITAEIAESTAHIRQQAYTEAYQQHIAQQKTPLLSMMKRREILAQIATCEMKVARFVKNGDRYIMLYEDPRPRDIMQAMQIDAKFEDACNRMRNFNDPVLSQFNIYIDGRPCDQPHLPPDPNLPPGIYMLPRRRKNQIEGTGIILEQNILKDSFPVIREGGTNVVSDGRVDEGSTSAQNQNQGSETNLMPQIENQNSGINSEHLSRQVGENTLSPSGAAGGGTLAQEKAPNPETNLIPQIENQNSGIKTEQNQETPLLPVPPVRDLGGENGEMPTGMSHSGVVDEGSTSGEARPDPLAASFYKQDRQARASAPPPHILTPEEVKALDEEYAQQHKGKPATPSTFGKMYFKEKGPDYNNLE